MKNELFLITNIHRSGSSMMIRCLEAGGMPVAFDIQQDIMNSENNTPDYIPNPNGFYGPPADLNSYNVVEKYSGKALKFAFHLLPDLKTNVKINIVFLKRNPEEIRASMDAFRPNGNWGIHKTVLDNYDEFVNGIISEIEKRENTILTILNYAEIVENPTKEFQKLKNAGWNFDVEKAVTKVDSSLYRLKLERK